MPQRQPERLTTRIISPHDPDPSTEDIFSSALDTLFTDDTHQSHGVPGQSIIYRSPRLGDVYLQIPSHPDEERGRSLFAHYLWNAGVIAAEAIERASCDDDDGGGSQVEEEVVSAECGDGNMGEEIAGEGFVQWDKRFWDMRGKSVLELGAATALPSVISTLCNASLVVSTDHPSSPAITMNAIESNFKINVTSRGTYTSTSTPTDSNPSDPQKYTNDHIPNLNHPKVTTTTTVQVYGYTWGTETFYATTGYGQPADPQPARRSFDRVVIADCLWMPAQHENLVKTVLSYLRDRQEGGDRNGRGRSRETKEESVPCALVVAGFHTGRAIVRDFVEVATGSVTGDGGLTDEILKPEECESRGQLRAAEIYEVDVEGRRRNWQPERPTETKEQSKRWCMCAVLVRR